MSYNKKAHLRANIDAIKIALTLDRENRKATGAELQVLQQYSGFGGLKCVLNPAATLADTASWAKSEIELFPLVSELHSVLRENTNSEREYRGYMSSIQNSVLSAFYTPPEVIGSINNALEEKGIIIDRFLDPSAGIGAFSSQFKLADDAESTCFEKDLLTGRILSALHPESKVNVEGFERIEGRYNNHFDVVASNIPFGEMKVFDSEYRTKQSKVYQDSTNYIHDYFFLKGLDSVREGGIVAFLTSQGVANSPKGLPVRTHLMSQADLVSVVRLPNNLFIDSAGTEVGSDLIILQKNTGKKILSEKELDFVNTHKNEKGESINNLFAGNKLDRVVHTKVVEDTDMYGKPSFVYLHDGGTKGIAADLQKMLTADFSQNLNTELYHSNSIKPHIIETVQSNSPTEEDLREMGAYFDELDKKFTQKHPPTPEDYGIKEEKAKPEESLEVNVSAPIISLYDLWGFSEEERIQVKPKRGQKKVTTTTQTVQKDLFGNPVNERHGRQTKPKDTSTPSQEKPAKGNTYPVSDARKEEAQKQWEEYIKPRPYSGELKDYHKEGTLVKEENGQIGVLKKRYQDSAEFHPLDIPQLQKGKLEKYIKVRDSYNELYDFEAKNLTEDAGTRKKLNESYDDYVRLYGNLNDKRNINTLKMDAGATAILALERSIDGKLQKADIFDHPVAFNPNEIVSANTSEEALIASLNKHGEFRMDYMLSLLENKTPDELIRDLEGRIYFNPIIQNFEIRDKFIAGNVVEKAERVERYLANHPDDIQSQKSLAALHDARPQPIRYEELDFNFGERWVPM
ncbi:N-6 DNA methylase, partial [Bacteroidales bacterium OttesenSCG-928-J19]|nr:N-6 DNA methylase [Bacteroidales bacterium OttesenSCG-928-J19]